MVITFVFEVRSPSKIHLYHDALGQISIQQIVLFYLRKNATLDDVGARQNIFVLRKQCQRNQGLPTTFENLTQNDARTPLRAAEGRNKDIGVEYYSFIHVIMIAYMTATMAIVSDPIPLSALQHWAYCPRQCGLIYIEQVFDDNIHTLRGNAEHAKTDQPSVETAKGVRVERALPLWEDAIGLIGKSDVVEFLAKGVPYPVEYKHGSRHKAADIAACDDIQLVGQALCLQFMTGKAVNEGALYYATSKRRRVVPITDAMRHEVVEIADAVRAMLAEGVLPAPLTGEKAVKRCKNCSLIDRCQPTATNQALLRARAALFDPEA